MQDSVFLTQVMIQQCLTKRQNILAFLKIPELEAESHMHPRIFLNVILGWCIVS